MSSSRLRFFRFSPFIMGACLAAAVLLGMGPGPSNPVSPPAAPTVGDPFYPPYTDVLTYLQSLATTYPTIVSHHVLGQETHGTRDIVALKISDNASVEEDEPSWVFTGIIHGKEQIGLRTLLDLAEELTTDYGTVGDVTDWVDAYEIWIVAVLNPWGYDHDTTGAALVTGARKNGPNTGITLTSGVDLARNYDFRWGTCEGATLPDDKHFIGLSPFSERETQIIRDFFVEQRPVFGITFHQGNPPDGGQIMRPWSTSSVSAPPDADRLWDIANLYADWAMASRSTGPLCAATGVLTDPDGTSGCDDPKGEGDMPLGGDIEFCDDLCWRPWVTSTLGACGQPSNWYYHEVGTFDYTVEVSNRMFNGNSMHDPAGPSDARQQDRKDIATEFARNHQDAIKAWFDYFLNDTAPFRFTGPGLTGHVTDALVGTPLAATVEVDGFTSGLIEDRTSDHTFGRYWRLLPAATHRVTVTKPGYETWEDDVTVGAGALTELNVGLTPTLEIILPNATHVAWVGPPTDTHKFTVRLQLGSAGDACVGSLPFDVFVRDGTAAWIEASAGAQACVQDSYWISVEAPDSGDGSFVAGGTYDLRVDLDTVTGTMAASVHYGSREQDSILVMDISGSMGSGGKLEAAQEAATLLVHELTPDDQGALVWFTGDGTEPNSDAETEFKLTAMAVGSQTLLIGAVSSLSTMDMTSIGDGLSEALDESESERADADHYCSLVLLSDGLENEAAYWSDVTTRTAASPCTVHTIALGPETDEVLMEEISQKGTPGTDDDGSYHYATISDPVTAAAGPSAIAAQWPNRLAGVYDEIARRLAGRQRFFKALDVMSSGPTKHFILVDKTIGEAVFALNWNARISGGGVLALYRPDGSPVLPTAPGVSYRASDTHEVYRVMGPMPGLWRAVVEGEQNVPYILLASGQTAVEFEIFTSADARPVREGEAVHILGLLTSRGRSIAGADVRAIVEAPGGVANTLQLFDDGLHGDGSADDGFYANVYNRTIAGDEVDPKQDPDGGQGLAVRGSYNLEATAQTPDFLRMVSTSFSAIGSLDSDSDGMPDPWELAHGLNPVKPADAAEDPDFDFLTNLGEFQAGTDPHDSDTDDGGESDYSEVGVGRDPLWPADDAIAAISDFSVSPLPEGALFTWTPDPSHADYGLARRLQGGDTWLRDWHVSMTGTHTVAGLTNGATYEFMMVAAGRPIQNQSLRTSQQVSMSANTPILSVTPVKDPFPPEGSVSINGGAEATSSRAVSLTFQASDETTVRLQMRYGSQIEEGSGEVGGSWRAFQSQLDGHIPIEVGAGGQWTVYAQFRDRSGNESEVVADSIWYRLPVQVYLPLALRNHSGGSP